MYTKKCLISNGLWGEEVGRRPTAALQSIFQIIFNTITCIVHVYSKGSVIK